MNSFGKSYNALTGAEIKATILREIERALDNAGVNSCALTYPLASWSWTLTLCQKDSSGNTMADIPERTLTAGEPLASVKAEAAENPAEKILRAISGGSKRFGQQPPSPTKVRETEKLPLPEA
jgi:hypothetical protein